MTLRVAFRVEGPAGWMGGVNYLLNICRVLRTHVPKIEPVLFVPPGAGAGLARQYVAANGKPPVEMSERSSGAKYLSILGFNDRRDMRCFAEHGIDLVFESAGYYGPDPTIPILAWLPDFQHQRLPHLFPRKQWWSREVRYRRVLSTRHHVMLSSMSAEADMKRYYGDAKGTVHVVPFAVQLDREASWEEGEGVRIARDLPERFLFMPNQFWSHKNHRLVVEALGSLGEKAPVVAASGHPDLVRSPTLIAELQARAAALGVANKFRVLGQLPYPELLALNARADRVINPSLFEGWSTIVEESRALGTLLLLSDIDVHREQAPPETIFFDPVSATSCADAMLTAMAQPARRQSTTSNAYARADAESLFAQRLASAIADAVHA